MNARIKISRTLAAATALALLTSATAEGNLLFSASLKNGDYGSGQTLDTLNPDHGGSPHVLGIEAGVQGVTFTPTEPDGRSNAVIYWQPGSQRTSFVQHGTVAMWIYADRDVVSAMSAAGTLWSDNYSWTAFRNGQASIASNLFHHAAGDQAGLTWQVLDGGAWRHLPSIDRPTFDYGQWHNVGYAWGGPDNDYEIWIDGELAAAFTPPVALPWGVGGAATNVGLGDLHERGYNVYGSVAGVTMRDIEIWDEYVALGGTIPEPTSPVLLLSVALAGATFARRRCH